MALAADAHHTDSRQPGAAFGDGCNIDNDLDRI